MSEALDQKLTTLKLARMRQVYASWIEQAAHSELGYGGVSGAAGHRGTAGTAGEPVTPQDESGWLPLRRHH